jgi:hypothetical protein
MKRLSCRTSHYFSVAAWGKDTKGAMAWTRAAFQLTGKAKGDRGIIVDFHEGLEGMANVVGWRAQYARLPCGFESGMACISKNQQYSP